MKILSIETSCDETAVSIVEAEGGTESPVFKILGNSLFSQVNTHREYGGVYPMLAKREHGKNLPPLLMNVLKQAEMYAENPTSPSYGEEKWQEIKYIVSREDGLFEGLISALKNIEKPKIDVIGVTSGPGLAPALWVGISCAEALGKLWDIPVVPINHMEGHIASVLICKTEEFSIFNFQFSKKTNTIRFPALALLISGGHTELVSMKGWGEYEVMGQTLDDAVGEAFDKVARMMGLPYPGGPEISRLAEFARENNLPNIARLPRPMIHSGDSNFSFSGLKTAVLYYIRDKFSKDHSKMTIDEKADLAREFEDAVVDVLLKKTNEALERTGAKTLIVAGGVIANKKIRQAFTKLADKFSDLILKIPTNSLATDNSLMIAAATYLNVILNPKILDKQTKIIASGNLKLAM
ncbi:MAG TPA: tRNA (adenosine(37)-N6)-threonylcarbamoyltransferase complex transferase subunit TsaD [Candidatus Paceibacterota bacterium]